MLWILIACSVSADTLTEPVDTETVEADADTDTDTDTDSDADTDVEDTGPWDADGDGWNEADDCDDTDPERHPGAVEWCDGIDTDCDGIADDADAQDRVSWYRDADADGFGSETDVVTQCVQPFGYLLDDTDCDDTDDTINPDAVDDTLDGIDQNCDGDTDEDWDCANSGGVLLNETVSWYATQAGKTVNMGNISGSAYLCGITCTGSATAWASDNDGCTNDLGGPVPLYWSSDYRLCVQDYAPETAVCTVSTGGGSFDLTVVYQ